jgi:hypothetical protein
MGFITNDNRKELIEAMTACDVEKLKQFIKNRNPVILVSAPHNGKYFILPGHGDPEKEITLNKLEELEKDHNVILLIQAEGYVTADICTSEEEVRQREGIK